MTDDTAVAPDPMDETAEATGTAEAAEAAESAEAAAGPDTEGPQDEVAQLKDRLARALADYDNLQKRVQRDAALERERVKARVLEHFLQVYEYGKMAEKEAEKQPGALAQGVVMIVREFDRMLESEGVTSIGTVGEPFDREAHEAISEEPADGVRPGHVSRVIKAGYRLGSRVLRYAQVAVAPADAADASEE